MVFVAVRREVRDYRIDPFGGHRFYGVYLDGWGVRSAASDQEINVDIDVNTDPQPDPK